MTISNGQNQEAGQMQGIFKFQGKFAYCVCASMLACGAVQAQSVALYGAVDVNIRSIHNGNAGTVTGLGEGSLSASRFGVKGIEDLGGGWKAGFWLENGFKPQTGAPSSSRSFFNRRSTVSLISDDYGELRLGRDNTPGRWNLLIFDPYGGGGVGAFTNLLTGGGFPTPLLSGAGTLARADNAVGYFLPANLSGVYGQFQYSFHTADAHENKHIGARLGYASDPIDIAISSNNTQLAENADFSFYDLGLTWKLRGGSRLMAQYAYMGTSRSGEQIARSRQDTFMVGAAVPINAHQFNVSYGRGQGGGALDDLKVDMYTVGGIYNLSKKTAIYANAAIIRNQGKSAYVTGPIRGVTVNKLSAAGAFTSSNAAGAPSTGFEIGLRKWF